MEMVIEARFHGALLLDVFDTLATVSSRAGGVFGGELACMLFARPGPRARHMSGHLMRRGW